MSRASISRSMVLSTVAAAAVLAVAPSTAGAAIYCAPSPCSPGTPEPTIKAAIDAADLAAGPDTVAIKAGTHTVGTGVTVSSPDTDVHGAGVAQTIVTGDPFPPGDPGSSRTLIAGYMPSLTDLTLRLPSVVTAGPSSWQGADVYDGLVQDVKVDAVGATFGPDINDGAGIAMLIRDGEAKNLDIDIPFDADATGLRVGGFGTSVKLEDITIHSPYPFSSDPEDNPSPGTTTAKRMRIESPNPLNVSDGFMNLTDSVIDVSAAPSGTGNEDFPVAITVFDGRPPHPAGLTMDRVTIVGNGDANATVLSVAGQDATDSAATATYIRARHIAADGVGRTVAFQNYGSDPTATVNFSAVPLGAGTLVNTNPMTPATLHGNQTTGNRGGDPGLLPDFQLPFGSPAVDIGGAPLIPGAPTDLAGNPRPADGDGDGTVLNDAGAFERQYTPDGATLTIEGRKVKLNEKGKGTVGLTCPPPNEQPGPCTAKLKLKTAKSVLYKGRKKPLTLAKTKVLTIAAGSTKQAKIRIRGDKLALVQAEKKARKTIATAKVTDGNGERGTVAKKLKLKP